MLEVKLSDLSTTILSPSWFPLQEDLLHGEKVVEILAAILNKHSELRPCLESVHRWCVTEQLWARRGDGISGRALPNDVESELRGLSARTRNPAGRDWDRVLEER
ncbi:unnamed protein product, partial [Sphacelaria rigidula]